jgi:hypothetical protein
MSYSGPHADVERLADAGVDGLEIRRDYRLNMLYLALAKIMQVLDQQFAVELNA